MYEKIDISNEKKIRVKFVRSMCENISIDIHFLGSIIFYFYFVLEVHLSSLTLRWYTFLIFFNFDFYNFSALKIHQ